MRKNKRAIILICKVIPLCLVLCILTFFSDAMVYAAKGVSSNANVNEIGGSTKGEVQDPDDPENFEFNITTNAGTSSLSATLQMVLVLTVLSIAPSILIMLTSFTRIIVVLHFVRSALGTQTTPPNQVLVGLALFLTLFIMSPVINQVNKDCVQPFQKGEIKQEEALNAGLKPIREFMFKQTNRSDIKLFLEIEGKNAEITSKEDIPTMVLIPSFMISELRTAFIIGFLIYLPFIVIDMIVSSTLMSMGMMMLPPTTISMPFKILLFVLADGWNLIIGQLVKTFY
ncbi:flagellar type III secretion system pore protein FliP [Eubacterium xylanophilum]|uniref:flagellar type III secretion system pore protein FliP n=1 Tax=Eubacterium xylanophilum TaxID=39497 RepID=UPI00047D09A0|nr:flagellar type III secretion system pore protein FliP [Eubacterium xylanophilum]